MIFLIISYLPASFRAVFSLFFSFVGFFGLFVVVVVIVVVFWFFFGGCVVWGLVCLLIFPFLVPADVKVEN